MGEADGRRRLSARAYLKRATDNLHQDMHRHPLMTRLLEDDVSFREACAVAAVSHCVADQLEAVRNALGVWADLALTDYLAQLGSALGRRGSDPVRLDMPQTQYGVIGGLYVLHGSTFGGAVLARHVRGRLGDVAARLFPACDTTRWSNLLVALANLDEQQTKEATAGALQLFEQYKFVADHGYRDLVRTEAGAHPSWTSVPAM